MKPLYWIAIGLAVVVFTAAPDDKYDVSEVLGCLLVLVGYVRLVRAAPDLPLRLTLGYLAVLSLIVAAVLSPPDARAWLDDADPAVVWASSLPALGFQAALCHALGTRAREARARSGWWWFVAETAILVSLVANVLYNGAGWQWLYGVGTVGLAGVLLVIALCALLGSAPWAGAEPAESEPSGDLSP
ncbi:hypothetical protein [Nocardioides sp. SLBN-35]|uniref:hypothetical protein n=1 Tax=Nocardioides sp. SLBN-35 TaxID=2768445 RepID=UPI00114F1B5E|nr:hypothetical protein [Nocardioides sp. SLBN-35]TQK68587.1 hypothetical protein FBY23_0340 [Nocardioides sp. SLBN-35]